MAQRQDCLVDTAKLFLRASLWIHLVHGIFVLASMARFHKAYRLRLIATLNCCN